MREWGGCILPCFLDITLRILHFRNDDPVLGVHSILLGKIQKKQRTKKSSKMPMRRLFRQVRERGQKMF